MGRQLDDGLGAYVLSNAPGVVELRRYAMHPGRRDELIELFEREFIETQEACGMMAFGHYRDVADPDAFVWMRGFARMEDRAPALEAFYRKSITWKTHRDAANATLLDSDNVLLLRNARGARGVDLAGLVRPDRAREGTVVPVTIFMLETRATVAFIETVERMLVAGLAVLGERIAYWVSEERPNDFPALPVRESEFAFVITGICRDDGAVARWIESCDAFEAGAAGGVRILSRETLRLAPAARSLYQ